MPTLNLRKLAIRKTFDYYELRRTLQKLRTGKKIPKTTNLRQSKKKLIDVYNEYVENHNKRVSKIKKVRKSIKQRNELTTFIVNVDVMEQHIYTQTKIKGEEVHSVLKKYDMLRKSPIEMTFKLKNESEISNVITDLLHDYYPIDDGYKTIEMKDFKYIVKQAHSKVKAGDVPMKKATPFNVSFLKHFKSIDPISYENSEGECVLRTLAGYFKIRRRATLIKSFEVSCQKLYKKPFELKNGITGNMILEFCKERNISCLGLDQRTQMFVKNTADKSRGRAYRKSLIFYMCLGHMYIITDETAIRSLSSTFANNNTTFKSSLEVQHDNKTKTKTFYENLPLHEALELKTGDIVIYEKSSLNDLLAKYLQTTNDMPTIHFGSVSSINKIITKNGASLVCSAVYGENLSWKIIRDVCNSNKIEFNNQGLGTLLNQLQSQLYSKGRKTFTKEERETIKTDQNGICLDCKDELKKGFHIDHIKPLASGGTNIRSNLQALCVSCHLEKCKQENEACEYILIDKFISAFNLQALEIIKSKQFRKVAFTENLPQSDKVEMAGRFAIDMVKCRRNILLHYGADFARYSVLDNIEPFNGRLTTGFYYIETYQQFPLRGNGFYSLPMILYALKNELINKSDIKYQFKPSMIIKHNEFGELVDFVLNAFKEHPKTAKKAINSLVGMFGRRNGTYIESRICERDNLDDIGNAYEQLDKPYCVNLNGDIVAVNSSRRIEKIELHYPIHAQILDCEAIELHKITKRIEKWGAIPLEIKTDCVNYASNHEIELYGYWDTQNTIKKYRCEEYKPLKHEINISNTETLEIEPNIYNNVCEIDDFNELANNIILSNKGCLMLGMAGCGKTYLTNKIIDLLENQEKKVVKLAPTNKATLNIKGKTLDKFSYGLIQGTKSIKKFSNIDYVIIDEVSMMKEIFYQVLLYIKKYNPSIKFIIVGDFGQLEPVKDRCKFNYENSRCLYELVDGNKLTLTVCKRSNNKLFNECLRVRDNKPLKYKYVPETETYLNVSYTNSTRKFINEECFNRFISQNENVKTAKIEALPYDKNSQSYLLAKGMPVISRINSKSMGIVNNETFMVIKITNEFITVKNELNEEKEVKKATFNRLFHLAFCITVHKSQGATFNKPYTIYDWEIMNNKLKYVAISRATKIENIQIERL